MKPQRLLLGLALGALLAWHAPAAAEEKAQKKPRTGETKPQQEDPEKKQDERGVRVIGPERPGAPTALPPLDRTPVLPPAPTGPEWGSTLSTLGELFVSDIDIAGGGFLPDEATRPLLDSVQGRTIRVEELHALREQVSRLYFDRGFVNSGVVIPDQEVEQGRIVLQEVQGRVGRIDLEGNRRLNDRFLLQRIRRGTGQPLQINDLQQTLQLLQQHPMVRRINARLLPGTVAGDSTLAVAVRENSPLSLVIGADNYRSPTVGAEQLTFSLAHQSLTGNGDVLHADLSLSDGIAGGGLSYAFPLDARDTTLSAYYSQNESDIVEEPFDRLDIVSESETLGLSVSYALERSPRRSLIGLAGFEVKHTESTLLGIPFSFSPGDRDGESDASVLWLGWELTLVGSKDVLAARWTVRRGIDVLDPSIDDRLPDGRFTSSLVQLNYGRRFEGTRSQLLVRSTLQFSGEPLLAMEKLPVGGSRTVRGYRENLLVRDDAFVASLEWRVPLFRNATGEATEARFRPKQLQLAPFADFGAARDLEDRLASSDTEEIYSVGLGALWAPWPGVGLDVWWGLPLHDIADTSGDLQDDGIHFRLSYRLPH